MKINEYYRDAAHMNLNGSIAALVPTTIIIIGNFSVLKNREIMLLALPFMIYSLISFQVYLFRMRQSITIRRNMKASKDISTSIFKARHLLVLYRNSQSSSLFIYFPNGHMAGQIKKFRGTGKKRFKLSRSYALYNEEDQVLGYFELKGRKVLKIDVFDRNQDFLGRFEKRNIGFRKAKKELFDHTGRFIGEIEGSSVFMDELVYDHGEHQVGRLRRGWMPMEWSPLFPEPNTPVLSLKEGLSEKDKLLRMSLLINEYFIER
ncbi:hypothetical protein FB550_10262 [Neobacillus bataviensis]|jgi:hypothetical protein|uniref:Uncharacterized protein n=2 Tax=Neobacillus TaxID=2675232 RepID=A0A561DRN5_9BACI|nr:hypothetical protein [Neobacillus bataviensis]TWE06044.1 hypothetical protein FB550_10262 [Neobacillus bataviensis]